MTIYKITNEVNGKIYIGQTTRTLEVRFREHLRHDSPIGKALRKYGVKNFAVEQIDKAETIEALNDKEIYWISFFNCMVPNGYNQCEGGGNTRGYHHQEESKQKIALAKMGEHNAFYGKHHNEDTIKAFKESRKGSGNPRALQVMCVETGEVFDCIKDAAEKYNVCRQMISKVCKGKRGKTGGYHWKYINN